MKQNKNSGVALIITLIMLSIITVMAVAFLALSRRERASVVHSANSIDAELMGSSALERAKAEILANIIGYSNFLGPDFFVSGSTTNYAGDPTIRTNYLGLTYYGDPRDGNNDGNDRGAIGRLLTGDAPPVFVVTNRVLKINEQRFYLDLNRNGRYDTNGLLEVLDAAGIPIRDASNNIVYGVFIGDPVWRGILSRPQLRHSKDSRFIGRYAFLVIPVGRTLDFNFIHNDAVGTIGGAVNTTGEGYRRNQGVGSWEINLAAFLTDLNSTPPPQSGGYYGQYFFDPTGSGLNNNGAAFFDAKQLLSFRYAENWQTLSPVAAMLPVTAFNNKDNRVTFTNDGIDAFLRGPVMAFGAPLAAEADPENEPGSLWSGSDSAKHFFSIHDVFRSGTPKANLAGFTNRIGITSSGLSSYDRYTYYRMLAQLGTDSAPETDGRINVNYKNTEGIGATNYVAWQPLEFFTNAAIRLLREEFKTNTDVFATVRQFKLPVAVRGITNSAGDLFPLYTSRIHRLLQVAANIYEATVSQKTNESAPYYPTVFRPQFEQFANGDIYITNYVPVTEPNFVARVLNGTIPLHDMNETNGVAPNDLVYGVPLIIGARKGFPNFNEFAVQTIANFTRKLEVRKNVMSGPPTETNHMFVVGISNVFAMEAWNSYLRDYPRPLNLVFSNVVTTVLTNDAGLYLTNIFSGGTNTLLPDFTAQQFRTAGIYLNAVMPDAVYRYGPPPTFDPISQTNIFDRTKAIYTNQWGLTVRSKLFYFLVDNGNIVDAFTASDLNGDFDITRELNNPEGDQFGLWNNDPAGNITVGMQTQIRVSKGELDVGSWNSYSYSPASGNDKEKSINGFLMFLGLTPVYGKGLTNSVPYTNLTMQAPFTPTRKLLQTSRWEVNDPLVHFISDDLRKYENGNLTNDVVVKTMFTSVPVSITNDTSIGRVNDRYRPWGGNPNQEAANDLTAFDLRVKDSGVAQSDNWEFPTNKFPSIGWLGRVHRGTPWQTIYLKAYPFNAAEPDRWMLPDGGPGLAREAHPTNDWKLIDVFTAALHPNATRGRLSINQTNLAAWSAVLSGAGVTSLHDGTPGGDIVRTNRFVEPAAIEPPVLQIVEGINREREGMTNGNRFDKLGDILRVPELTVLSPYLNLPFISARAEPEKRYVLKDVDYERIPDQILSLLKVGEPRFVIYAFGQSLKPEFIDPGTGLALNYQITGEVATRAVVRVDFDYKPGPTPADPYEPDYLRPHIVVESFNILPPE